MPKKEKAKESAPIPDFENGLGGILKGLGGLVEKLGDLAESGRQFSKTGEIRGANKDLQGIYGFTVKVGLGDDKPRVEPFGNIRRDEAGHTVVQEVREPAADVFEEDNHVIVVLEMPGISAEDAHVEVVDDLLSVSAEKGDKKYRKEILLPGNYSREKMQVTCNNGVLEIRCGK